MRKTMRVRLAVFLSIMMILPVIVAVLPMTATDVSAAGSQVYLNWSWDTTHETIEVEQGQQFYLGDYTSISVDGKTPWYGNASLVKASYSSSESSVATIDSKGCVDAKGTGTTTVTVKYKGKKITATLEVVPTGTFATSKTISDLKEKAEKIAKKIPSKISTKNGFELNKLASEYRTYIQSFDEISERGFLKEKVTYNFGNGSYTSYYKATNKLAVPQAGRYMTLNSLLRDYGWKNNPTGTTGAKMLKIKSVSANTSAITIKLKKKVDTIQILAARINTNDVGNEKLSGKTKANISVYVYDKKGNKSYRCKAELKKGSNNLKLIPQTYLAQKGKWVNAKLEKGHTYVLENAYQWTRGKTVKVK